jgi:hypothetical protein
MKNNTQQFIKWCFKYIPNNDPFWEWFKDYINEIKEMHKMEIKVKNNKSNYKELEELDRIRDEIHLNLRKYIIEEYKNKELIDLSGGIDNPDILEEYVKFGLTDMAEEMLKKPIEGYFKLNKNDNIPDDVIKQFNITINEIKKILLNDNQVINLHEIKPEYYKTPRFFIKDWDSIPVYIQSQIFHAIAGCKFADVDYDDNGLDIMLDIGRIMAGYAEEYWIKEDGEEIPMDSGRHILYIMDNIEELSKKYKGLKKYINYDAENIAESEYDIINVMIKNNWIRTTLISGDELNIEIYNEKSLFDDRVDKIIIHSNVEKILIDIYDGIKNFSFTKGDYEEYGLKDLYNKIKIKGSISDYKTRPKDPTNILHLQNRVRVFDKVLDAYIQICYDIKQLEKNDKEDIDGLNKLNETKSNLYDELFSEAKWLEESGGSNISYFNETINKIVNDEIEDFDNKQKNIKSNKDITKNLLDLIYKNKLKYDKETFEKYIKIVKEMNGVSFGERQQMIVQDQMRSTLHRELVYDFVESNWKFLHKEYPKMNGDQLREETYMVFETMAEEIVNDNDNKISIIAKDKEICIDLDGTIVNAEGVQYPEIGPVIKENVNKIKLLKEKGYKITIFTARDVSKSYIKEKVEKYLNDNDVKFDKITNVKPSTGLVYIDDRALHIKQNKPWDDDIIEKIENIIKEHEKKVKSYQTSNKFAYGQNIWIGANGEIYILEETHADWILNNADKVKPYVNNKELKEYIAQGEIDGEDEDIDRKLELSGDLMYDMFNEGWIRINIGYGEIDIELENYKNIRVVDKILDKLKFERIIIDKKLGDTTDISYEEYKDNGFNLKKSMNKVMASIKGYNFSFVNKGWISPNGKVYEIPDDQSPNKAHSWYIYYHPELFGYDKNYKINIANDIEYLDKALQEGWTRYYHNDYYVSIESKKINKIGVDNLINKYNVKQNTKFIIDLIDRTGREINLNGLDELYNYLGDNVYASKYGSGRIKLSDNVSVNEILFQKYASIIKRMADKSLSMGQIYKLDSERQDVHELLREDCRDNYYKYGGDKSGLKWEDKGNMPYLNNWYNEVIKFVEEVVGEKDFKEAEQHFNEEIIKGKNNYDEIVNYKYSSQIQNRIEIFELVEGRKPTNKEIDNIIKRYNKEINILKPIKSNKLIEEGKGYWMDPNENVYELDPIKDDTHYQWIWNNKTNLTSNYFSDDAEIYKEKQFEGISDELKNAEYEMLWDGWVSFRRYDNGVWTFGYDNADINVQKHINDFLLEHMEDKDIVDQGIFSYSKEEVKNGEMINAIFGSDVGSNIKSSDKNMAEYNGKKFWIGSFNTLNGEIEETHTYEEAKENGFHHSFYFSPQTQENMYNEDSVIFWIKNGKIELGWRESLDDIMKNKNINEDKDVKSLISEQIKILDDNNNIKSKLYNIKRMSDTRQIAYWITNNGEILDATESGGHSEYICENLMNFIMQYPILNKLKEHIVEYMKENIYNNKTINEIEKDIKEKGWDEWWNVIGTIWISDDDDARGYVYKLLRENGWIAFEITTDNNIMLIDVWDLDDLNNDILDKLILKYINQVDEIWVNTSEIEEQVSKEQVIEDGIYKTLLNKRRNDDEIYAKNKINSSMNHYFISPNGELIKLEGTHYEYILEHAKEFSDKYEIPVEKLKQSEDEQLNVYHRLIEDHYIGISVYGTEIGLLYNPFKLNKGALLSALLEIGHKGDNIRMVSMFGKNFEFSYEELQENGLPIKANKDIKAGEAIIYPAWWIAPDRKIYIIEESDVTHAEWVIDHVEDIVSKYIPDIEDFLDSIYDEDEDDYEDDEIYEKMYLNGWTRVRRYGSNGIFLQVDFPESSDLRKVESLIAEKNIMFDNVGLSKMGGMPLSISKDMLMEEGFNLAKIYNKYKEAGIYSYQQYHGQDIEDILQNMIENKELNFDWDSLNKYVVNSIKIHELRNVIDNKDYNGKIIVELDKERQNLHQQMADYLYKNNDWNKFNFKYSDEMFKKIIYWTVRNLYIKEINKESKKMGYGIIANKIIQSKTEEEWYKFWKELAEKEKSSEHLERNPYIEYVSTNWISKFQEFDRLGEHRSKSLESLEGLKRAIGEIGIVSPIYLNVNPVNKTCKIGEGNHRVTFAKMLGIDKVPVYIMIDRSGEYNFNHKCEDIRSVKEIMKFGSGEPYNVGEPYLPQEMKPSHVFKNITANKNVDDWDLVSIMHDGIVKQTIPNVDWKLFWKEFYKYIEIIKKVEKGTEDDHIREEQHRILAEILGFGYDKNNNFNYKWAELQCNDINLCFSQTAEMSDSGVRLKDYNWAIRRAIDELTEEEYKVINADKKEQEDKKYGCLMVKLNNDLSNKFKQFANNNIKEENLYKSKKLSYVNGIPNTTHCTILFGMVEENIDEIKKYCHPIKMKLGKICKFPSKDEPYDCLYIEGISKDAIELNKELREKFENYQTFPEYKVHITLCYVKKDNCDNLLGQTIIPEKSMGIEQEFILNEFKYSSPMGKKYEFESNKILSKDLSTEVYDGSEEMSYSQDLYFTKNLDNIQNYLYDENFAKQVVEILNQKGYHDVNLENIYSPELRQQCNEIINQILMEQPSRSKSNNLSDIMPEDIDLKNWIGILK